MGVRIVTGARFLEASTLLRIRLQGQGGKQGLLVKRFYPSGF